MARAGTYTTDHDEIRRWVEERGGHPAHVKRKTRGPSGVGILRIDFPGYSGEGSLEAIGWDDFFAAFEENGLAFLHTDTTAEGEVSRFCKLVARQTAKARQAGLKTSRHHPARSRASTDDGRSGERRRPRAQADGSRPKQRRTRSASASGEAKRQTRPVSARTSSKAAGGDPATATTKRGGRTVAKARKRGTRTAATTKRGTRTAATTKRGTRTAATTKRGTRTATTTKRGARTATTTQRGARTVGKTAKRGTNAEISSREAQTGAKRRSSKKRSGSRAKRSARKER